MDETMPERIVDWFGEMLWRAPKLSEAMQSMSPEARNEIRMLLVEGLTLTFRDMADVPYRPALPRRPWGETID